MHSIWAQKVVECDVKGGVGRIAGGGVMYATDTDHVGIPFVALLAPSEHRVRNTRLQSIMQTAVQLVAMSTPYHGVALCDRYTRVRAKTEIQMIDIEHHDLTRRLRDKSEAPKRRCQLASMFGRF